MRLLSASKCPGLLAGLVAALLLASAHHTISLSERADAATKASEDGRGWSVRKPENGGPWEIGFGSNGNFPQFAALHPRDGYFRLVCKTTFGTSIVLPPVFWSGGVLTQGMPLDAKEHVEGDRLIIDATGNKNGLKVTLRVALSRPGDGRIEAVVNGNCEGTVALDPRPGEAFKPVMLSSMRVGGSAGGGVSKEWDARAVIVEGRPDIEFADQVTSNAFFVPPATFKVRRFGFRGGKSDFQKGDPAPTVEILFNDTVPIAGYRTRSCNHDDDNLAYWAGFDTVLGSWHYTITAMRPAD
jgi:hypothetical protein